MNIIENKLTENIVEKKTMEMPSEAQTQRHQTPNPMLCCFPKQV